MVHYIVACNPRIIQVQKIVISSDLWRNYCLRIIHGMRTKSEFNQENAAGCLLTRSLNSGFFISMPNFLKTEQSFGKF